jgi:hypothetical protein
MQLYDYILWHNQTKNATNAFVTRLAMITNHLQPLVLALAIVALDKKRVGPITRWLLPVYTIVAVVYSIYAWFGIDYTLVTESSRGSLFWAWNYQGGYIAVGMYTMFLLTLCVLAYEHYERPINWIFVICIVLSFLFGSIYFKGRTEGRFWCWTAGFIPLILVVLIVVLRKV